MLKGLHDWQRKRQVRKLTEQLGGNVSSRLYVELMDLLKEDGDEARAKEVMYLGLHRFPESPELRKRRREIVYRDRENEKKRLHTQLLEEPKPELYARLAEINRLNLDVQGMWRVCVAGLQAFPKSPPLLLAQAHAWLEVNNLPVASRRLEELLEAEPHNYVARKLLGQAHLQMGRREDALRHLAEAQHVAPDDTSLNELTELARGTPPAAGDASGKEERTNALKEILGPLAAEPGLMGAFVLDANGALLFCMPGAKLDGAMAATLFTQVRSILVGGSRTLGIGEFGEALLETEVQRIWVEACNGWLLVVLADRKVDPAPLTEVIHGCVKKAKKMPR